MRAMGKDFKSAAEVHADAMAHLPDLARMTREELKRLRVDTALNARPAVDEVTRFWWGVHLAAINTELKQRAHGKPRTQAGARHQAFRRLLVRCETTVERVRMIPHSAFTGRFWQ